MTNSKKGFSKRQMQVYARLRLIERAIKQYANPRLDAGIGYSDLFSLKDIQKWLCQLINNKNVGFDFSSQLLIYYLKLLEQKYYLNSIIRVNSKTTRNHRLYYLTWDGFHRKINSVFKLVKPLPKFNKSERGVLELLKKNGLMTGKEMKNKLNYSRRTIQYALNHLLTNEIIGRMPSVDDTRMTVYFLIETPYYIKLF